MFKMVFPVVYNIQMQYSPLNMVVTFVQNKSYTLAIYTMMASELTTQAGKGGC